MQYQTSILAKHYDIPDFGRYCWRADDHGTRRNDKEPVPEGDDLNDKPLRSLVGAPVPGPQPTNDDTPSGVCQTGQHRMVNGTIWADEPGVTRLFGSSRRADTNVWYIWHMPPATGRGTRQEVG